MPKLAAQPTRTQLSLPAGGRRLAFERELTPSPFARAGNEEEDAPEEDESDLSGQPSLAKA